VAQTTAAVVRSQDKETSVQKSAVVLSGIGVVIIIACAPATRSFEDTSSGTGDAPTGSSSSVGEAGGAGGSMPDAGESDTGGPDAGCGALGGPCCEGTSCHGGATCQASACACPPGVDACGDACVALPTDGHNCGACGHDCLGGACLSGVCQPVDIATKQGRLFMIQVDGTSVYWGGDGVAISRRPKNLSGPAVVLASKEYAYSWALDAKFIYWSNDSNNKAIRRCGLPDCAGGPSDIAAGASAIPIGAMTTDPARKSLFFRRTDAPVIFRMDLSTGQIATLSSVAVSPRPFAADAAFLYYADGNAVLKGQGAIMKVAQTGGAPIALANGTAVKPANSMAVNGKTVYWHQDSAIYAAPLPNGIGSTLPKSFALAGSSVFGIAADGKDVYWCNHTTTGNVSSCPVSGCIGAPKVVAAGQSNPWGIALDDKAVYWVTEAGEVRMVAR
jgi:hypothetical protein